MVAYLRIAPNPRFNPALTMGSAKSAHRFGCVSLVASPWGACRPNVFHVCGASVSVGRNRPGTRKSCDADLRYADLFDAAHQDALASGAPAPVGGERGQRRHPKVRATRSRPTEFRPDQGADRLADARAYGSGPYRRFGRRRIVAVPLRPQVRFRIAAFRQRSWPRGRDAQGGVERHGLPGRDRALHARARADQERVRQTLIGMPATKGEARWTF